MLPPVEGSRRLSASLRVSRTRRVTKTVIKIVIVMTLTTVRMLTGSSYYLLLIKGSRRLSAPL